MKQNDELLNHIKVVILHLQYLECHLNLNNEINRFLNELGLIRHEVK